MRGEKPRRNKLAEKLSTKKSKINLNSNENEKMLTHQRAGGDGRTTRKIYAR